MDQRFRSVQRLQMILEACKGKRVLHLGCTNYPYTHLAIERKTLLHFDLQKVASELYGFDLDQPGIDILEEVGIKNLYQANLERLDEVDLNETFDVIIAGEMIEHILNPGLFFDGIKRFMRPDTDLIVTTINAYCGFRFIQYTLRGKGGRAEMVHPDHVAYYSYRTLTHMIEVAGFNVKEFYFYDVGIEHRPTLPWYYNLANDVCVALFPQLSDGVIAVCRLPEDSQNKMSPNYQKNGSGQP